MGTLISRRRPFTGPPAPSAPKRRFCRACHRDKTGASFSPGETRCRKCVRDEVEASDPKPVSRKRLCLVCGDHRGPSRFERHGGTVAETCDLCSTDPAIRVTLKQEDAAAVTIRVLHQIVTGRLDCTPGAPTLGVLAMQDLAQKALDAIEAAR